MSAILDSIYHSDLSLDPFLPVYEPTLNDTGEMIHSLDEFSEAFVEFSVKAPGPVLDVGAAYGVASLAALDRGAWVIANDIEPEHLRILEARAPQSQLRRLSLMPGDFPYECPVDRGSLGAVLLSRVLHFFSGADLRQALSRLFQALHTGGKLFAVVEQSIFPDHPMFEAIYRQRLSQNMLWPGFITGIKKLVPKRVTRIPNQLHLLDEDVLSRELTRAGFEIDRLEKFDRVVELNSFDSEIRPSVGVIARVP